MIRPVRGWSGTARRPSDATEMVTPRPVEVPAFAPQLGESMLRDVPLPDTGRGVTISVAPDGRLAVPLQPRTGRIMVRA